MVKIKEITAYFILLILMKNIASKKAYKAGK